MSQNTDDCTPALLLLRPGSPRCPSAAIECTVMLVFIWVGAASGSVIGQARTSYAPPVATRFRATELLAAKHGLAAHVPCRMLARTARARLATWHADCGSSCCTGQTGSGGNSAAPIHSSRCLECDATAYGADPPTGQASSSYSLRCGVRPEERRRAHVDCEVAEVLACVADFEQDRV